MILQPEEYGKHSAHELLSLADQGLVAFDHRLLRAVLADIPGAARYANERAQAEEGSTIAADLVEIFRHHPTAEAVPFLVALAEETRDEMPEEVIEALARVGAPALEPLLEAYQRHRRDAGDLPTAIAFLKTQDPRAMSVLAEQDEEESEFLREIADGPSETEPYDIFADYPETAVANLEGQPLKVRREFLASPAVEHRLAALSTFLEGDLDKTMAAELKRVAKEDPDAEVRGVAWETLEAEAAENKALLAEMIERLHGEDTAPMERAGLAVSLAQRKDPNFAKAAALLYDNPTTRAKALQAMWRSFNREFAPYAVTSLSDADPDVKQQAILAIGYLNQSSEVARLEKFFGDDTHRDTALFAYALCAPGETTRPRMKNLFRLIEDLAGGLSGEDAGTVEQALDLRLEMHGLKPVFDTDDEHSHSHEPVRKEAEPGRNDPCPCGSGKKYKKCHGA